MNPFAALVALDGAPVSTAEIASIAAHLGALHEQTLTVGPDRSFGFASAKRTDALAAALPSNVAKSARDNWILFDGRIDDRASLAARLGVDARAAGELSDAELALAGFESFGAWVFDRIVGPFVAVLIEPSERRVRLVRDPLGGRGAYFRLVGNRLAVASRPAALLGFSGAPTELDTGSIARFMALDGPRPGATYFRGIEEVAAGAEVRFEGQRRIDELATRLGPAPPPGSGSEREFESRFRELLLETVRCHLPGRGSAAILMSGGLDSTAVAAAAGQLLAARGDAPPTTFSWVFPQLSGCDESVWIEAANHGMGTQAVAIPGDELWPLSTEPDFQQFADSPVSDPYWPLVQRMEALARERGFRSVVTGGAGDLLWGGGRDWLRDLVLSGRLLRATSRIALGAALQLRHGPLYHPVWNSLGRLVRRDPWRPRQPRLRPWLTENARALDAEETARAEGDRPWNALRVRIEKLIPQRHLELMENTDRALAGSDFEYRRPFRDRRFVEFFLGLPARLLYQPGETKRLLRRSLAGWLPPLVLRRQEPTSLDPLMRRGLGDRAWPLVRETLADPNALWPTFVDRRWLDRNVDRCRSSADSAVERVVLWQCLCLERWRRSLLELPSGGDVSFVQFGRTVATKYD